MKLSLERAPLLAALARAVRAVERKNTIPILGHVLLRAAGDSVTIIATDLDIEITKTIDGAKIDQPGETTLPGHMFLDIVRKLPDGAQIRIEVDDKGQASVRAGRSRFTLSTLPPAEFPDLAGFEFAHAFTLTDKEVERAIGRVKFAISTEETRYYLNGIYFHPHDGPDGPTLRMVATDGHRLSLASLPAPEGAAGMPGIIIPRKAVDEILSLAASADSADIEFEISPVKLAVTAGATRIVTKLIDGTFPDYQRVIPQGGTVKVQMAASELGAAVDRVGTISNEKSKALKFAFEPETLTLSAVNADAGDASDEVSATLDGPGGITIGFNGRYVQDMLGAMALKGPVEFELTDPGSPAIVREPGTTDALCVLMPMRV